VIGQGLMNGSAQSRERLCARYNADPRTPTRFLRKFVRRDGGSACQR
jgi:hypothetical protein